MRRWRKRSLLASPRAATDEAEERKSNERKQKGSSSIQGFTCSEA